MREKFKNRYNEQIRGRNRRFNKRFKQYIIDYKGEDEEELNSTFTTIALDISSDFKDPNPELSTAPKTYFTLFRELDYNEAN
jgi:hypothetical protein